MELTPEQIRQRRSRKLAYQVEREVSLEELENNIQVLRAQRQDAVWWRDNVQEELAKRTAALQRAILEKQNFEQRLDSIV